MPLTPGTVLTAALANRTATRTSPAHPRTRNAARAATFYADSGGSNSIRVRGGQTPFPAWPLRSKLFFTVLSDKLCMNRERASAGIMPLNTSPASGVTWNQLPSGPPVSLSNFSHIVLSFFPRGSFSAFLLVKLPPRERRLYKRLSRLPSPHALATLHGPFTSLNSSAARLI